MNIQHIFKELESASDFELFRIKTAIEKVLEDPDRIQQLKRKIRVGMDVEYFCPDRNKSISCIVVDIKRSRVTVKENVSGQQWTLPFYFLNLDQVETELMSSKAVGMSKAEIAVGDYVGFFNSRDSKEHIGQVVKLNPKRVVIVVENCTWSVSYQMLFPVLVSETEETEESKQLLL